MAKNEKYANQKYKKFKNCQCLNRIDAYKKVTTGELIRKFKLSSLK